MTGSRAATRVLATVVALQLVAETALTPYWPQLLRQLFGVQELTATGGYLTACRLAGLAALPLWGLAARRWPLSRLLVASLLTCAALDLALALAPTLLLFTLASAGVVAAGSALVLAYPALVQVADRGRPQDRLSPVLVGVAVFHGASLLATVIGAGIVSLPSPRVGLAAFAAVDLLLALLVVRCVPTGPAPASQPRARVTSRVHLAPLGVVVAVAVLVDLGTSVPRPFFTALVLQDGGGLAFAALLFLLPSVSALAVLVVARPLASRLGPTLLPLAATTAGAGLGLQAVLHDAAVGAAAGRLLLGAGLGLLAVAVDLRIFAATSVHGSGFAAVETGRAAALLAAPALATAAASSSLLLPLLVGAGLLLAGGLLGAAPLRPAPPPVPLPLLEASRDRVPA